MEIKPNSFTDFRDLSRAQREKVLAEILWKRFGWRRRAHLSTDSAHATAFKVYCDEVVRGKRNLDASEFVRLLSACDNERRCASLVWQAPLLVVLYFAIGAFFY